MNFEEILGGLLHQEKSMRQTGLLTDSSTVTSLSPQPSSTRVAKRSTIMVTDDGIEQSAPRSFNEWKLLSRESKMSLDKQARAEGKRLGFDGKWQTLCKKCKKWPNYCECDPADTGKSVRFQRKSQFQALVTSEIERIVEARLATERTTQSSASPQSVPSASRPATVPAMLTTTHSSQSSNPVVNFINKTYEANAAARKHVLVLDIEVSANIHALVATAAADRQKLSDTTDNTDKPEAAGANILAPTETRYDLQQESGGDPMPNLLQTAMQRQESSEFDKVRDIMTHFRCSCLDNCSVEKFVELYTMVIDGGAYAGLVNKADYLDVHTLAPGDFSISTINCTTTCTTAGMTDVWLLTSDYSDRPETNEERPLAMVQCPQQPAVLNQDSKYNVLSLKNLMAYANVDGCLHPPKQGTARRFLSIDDSDVLLLQWQGPWRVVIAPRDRQIGTTMTDTSAPREEAGSDNDQDIPLDVIRHGDEEINDQFQADESNFAMVCAFRDDSFILYDSNRTLYVPPVFYVDASHTNYAFFHPRGCLVRDSLTERDISATTYLARYMLTTSNRELNTLFNMWWYACQYACEISNMPAMTYVTAVDPHRNRMNRRIVHCVRRFPTPVPNGGWDTSAPIIPLRLLISAIMQTATVEDNDV